MADTVDTHVIVSGSRRHVAHLLNLSDGTGESAVVKIDASSLIGPSGAAPSHFIVEWVQWDVQGFDSVTLAFDATADDPFAYLSGQGYSDWTDVGGLVDPQSAGSTGDIVLTTAGGASGSTYSITISVRLKD